ncbi:MAG: phytanoyl-CoA dioxygenase family protein [Pseudomonadota bacterium]
MALTQDQKNQFQDDGYCVVPDFISTDQIALLKQRAAEITQAFDPSSETGVFSTEDRSASADRFLLESGDKVRCFLEAGALDEEGNLTCPQSQAFNKIGHALHDLDPVFNQFSRQDPIRTVVKDLGITHPELWQSMYIFKPPRIGGVVNWHQDATYFFTSPISVITLWFALDDATTENGCLWVANSGPNTPLRERFVVNEGKSELVSCNAEPWPEAEEAAPLPVPAGALVCFQGTLPHYSAPNTSAHPRHAYTLHITDSQAEYAANNWLQRGPELPIRGFD